MEYVGLLGILLINVALVPQLVRIVRLKDSTDISVWSIVTMIAGLSIMGLKAVGERSGFFEMNYAIAVALEVLFLGVTLRYRAKK